MYIKYVCFCEGNCKLVKEINSHSTANDKEKYYTTFYMGIPDKDTNTGVEIETNIFKKVMMS
jgi:hypothetical protein